jgi:hypothetical protein
MSGVTLAIYPGGQRSHGVTKANSQLATRNSQLGTRNFHMHTVIPGWKLVIWYDTLLRGIRPAYNLEEIYEHTPFLYSYFTRIHT